MLPMSFGLPSKLTGVDLKGSIGREPSTGWYFNIKSDQMKWKNHQKVSQYFINIHEHIHWACLHGNLSKASRFLINAFMLVTFSMPHNVFLECFKSWKLIMLPAMYDTQLEAWQDVQLNGWLVHNPNTTQETHHTDRHKIRSLHNCWLTVLSNVYWCLIISFGKM